MSLHNHGEPQCAAPLDPSAPNVARLVLWLTERKQSVEPVDTSDHSEASEPAAPTTPWPPMDLNIPPPSKVVDPFQPRRTRRHTTHFAASTRGRQRRVLRHFVLRQKHHRLINC